MTVPTSDNLLLSRLIIDANDVAHFREINATHEVSEEVAKYVRESIAGNTRKAYLSDLAHFESWAAG